MAICPCCCTNRPTDGKFCICDDYTQMVIEIPGLDGPAGCGCAATTLVADLFSNEIQEFGTDNCRPTSGFPNYQAKYTVGVSDCGFVDCRHVAPLVLGNFLYTLDSTVGLPFAAYMLFQDYTRFTNGNSPSSNLNESCADFSARYSDRRISSDQTVNSSSCLPALGGSWSLQ